MSFRPVASVRKPSTYQVSCKEVQKKLLVRFSKNTSKRKYRQRDINVKILFQESQFIGKQNKVFVQNIYIV